MIKRISLSNNATYSVVTTVTLAAVSSLFNLTVARLFESDSASKIFSLWTFVNILILVFQAPIEIIVAKFSEPRKDISSRTISFYYFLISSLLIIGLSSLFGLLSLELDFQSLFAISFFIAMHSTFFWARTIFFSGGAFNDLMRAALVVLIFSSSVYFVCLLFQVPHPATVLFGVGIAYGIPLLRDSTPRLPFNRSLFKQVNSFLSFLTRKDVASALSSLIFGNFVSLIILTGGVVLAPLLEMRSEQIVAYSAMISLAMIPYLILNGLLLPIVHRAISQYRDGLHHAIFGFIYKTTLFFAIFVVVVSLLLSVIGAHLVGFMFGQIYIEYTSMFFWVSIATGLAVVSGLPRMILAATVSNWIFNFLLFVALSLFVIVSMTVSTPLLAVVLGTAMSSVLLLTGGVVLLSLSLRKKDS